ncbi:MAG: bifunctional UDP-N-acetylglucosamine diphosphorylase/glucosamine-1-phosphate N-acetyltransferase GlmU [Alphaproteobacteria bacterium]|nr:bifunctional UDP-N-acetylglucosamine diphosphorylase/glucosamine-1-phosphate N-acetyltransferase GlmU [Alphaproteobacteria bacterium]
MSTVASPALSPPMAGTTAVVLAAGMGTRMKSALPKALHPIAGRPMLRHLLAACEAVFERIVVVVGPDMAALEKVAAPHACVVQAERLGTAHAALQAVPHFGTGDVAVLYADNPLMSEETLRALLARRSGGAGLALVAMRPAVPGRYGRVIGTEDEVQRIVEAKDATPEELSVGLCNAGVLCGPGADMARWLAAVRNDNAAGEYYLTDLVALARAEGKRVAAVVGPEAELRGINSRSELAEAEATVQQRLRRAAMDAGVTMTAPETVFLSTDTRFGTDVSIAPNVVFGPGVSVESNVEIRAFSHLEGCTVRAGAVIGPFARLRPGADVGEEAHVGNFVEVKAAKLGRGVKANHLSYIGDAEIGARTNIGAGTITCNYDGFAKHRTVIGADVFIGSDSILVAPVSVGDGAMVTAGSVITENVPADAMAFGRARQDIKAGRAAAFRASRKKTK